REQLAAVYMKNVDEGELVKRRGVCHRELILSIIADMRPREIQLVMSGYLPSVMSQSDLICADPDTHVAFNADAIIANPPAYGHIHVAEFLKVPLHIFFTMPWTPTYEFPHPLSRVKQQMAYRLSYQIVNSLIWLGIRDLINEFRKKKLKLRPITYLSGSYTSPPNMPYGYIWSPYLVPKPKDWGPNIDVVGFCFLNLASDYEPPISLLEWLEEGEKEGKKPIYIGFGSLVSFFVTVHLFGLLDM
ncbi:hypothetical protein S83_028688, partial [Arachis hypogaea]